MQEIIKVSVNYGTTLEDIQALREEMLKFIKENNRDYRPEFEIEVLGVNDLDKLDLKIEIKHKVSVCLILFTIHSSDIK